MHRRRRLTALVVVLTAVAAVVPLLTVDERAALPEAGSSFRAAAPARHGEKSLLSALAPLLSTGNATRRSPGTPKGRSSGRSTAAARPAPGLPAERAAARLFVVGFAGTRPDASFFTRLRVRDWGVVLLTSGNYVDDAQIASLAGEIGVVARNAGHRTPLIAVRQAGGEDSTFPALPPADIFSIDRAADAEREAGKAGAALRSLGVTMNLAPDGNLGSTGGPWEGRAFDSEPAAVIAKLRASLAGYRRTRVLAAVGHFPGEGAASGDPATGPSTVGLGLDELRSRDLRPFKAVAHSAPIVQMSGALYAAWDGVTPATLLPEAVDLLRSSGFGGAVLSADLGAASFVSGVTPGDAAVAALNAGCDLLLLPGDARDQEQAVRAVVAALRGGRLKAARVRQALARVDALRRAYGIE